MKQNPLFSLEDQVIILTGGYGFLGTAMTEGLLDAGATVIVAGRKQHGFSKAFPEASSKLSFKHLDITDSESFRLLFMQVNDEFGKIDTIINNAVAIESDGKPENLSDGSFDKTMEGTVRSVYSAIREVLPYFRKQRHGRIINIGSMYGMVAPDFSIYDENPQFISAPHYGAGKAAVLQMTRYFASFLGKENILVNSISPGPFPQTKVQESTGFTSKLAENTVLGRFGKREELQGVVVFLCAAASGFITGHNLVVDGGWTIK